LEEDGGMLFDSHAHLNDERFEEDRDEVIRRAQEQGVSRILNIGFNRETIETTLSLVEQYDFIYAAVGWHPHDAATMTDEDLKWIRSLTEHPKVVALGEMGLDYYRNHSPREVQDAVFRRQIRLAREVGMPIVIHNREADRDVLRVLREEGAEEVEA
jgi:TatD DNase family protein